MLKVKFSLNRERHTTLKFLLFYDDPEETKGLLIPRTQRTDNVLAASVIKFSVT